jgi:hypothetical protein
VISEHSSDPGLPESGREKSFWIISKRDGDDKEFRVKTSGSGSLLNGRMARNTRLRLKLEAFSFLIFIPTPNSEHRTFFQGGA